MKSTVLIVAIGLLGACNASNSHVQAQNNDAETTNVVSNASLEMASTGQDALNGVWKSFACELRPQAGPEGVAPWYLTRTVTFGPERLDAHFITYSDDKCSDPLVELKFGGRTETLGPLDVAAGAQAVNLYVDDYLTLTPRQ